MSTTLFTVDELRALRRVAEVELPRFVSATDAGHVAVDAAALRGLAVRGLVTLDGGTALDGVRLGDELTRLLGPCASPYLLAEVELESADRLTHAAVAAGADGRATLLTELPAGLVSAEVLDAGPAPTLARLCRLDEATESVTGAGFTVAAEAQTAADGLVLAGDLDAAADLLTQAGVPVSSARAWVAAVAGRRYAASLSVARRRPHSDPIEAGELRWLVTGDGTAWLVEPGEAAAEPAAPWPEVQGPAYAVITPYARQRLYDEFTTLTGRAAANR